MKIQYTAKLSHAQDSSPPCKATQSRERPASTKAGTILKGQRHDLRIDLKYYGGIELN
jgi:hypothetical protein